MLSNVVNKWNMYVKFYHYLFLFCSWSLSFFLCLWCNLMSYVPTFFWLFSNFCYKKVYSRERKQCLFYEVTDIYIVKCYSLLKRGDCVGVDTQWVPGQESRLLFHPNPLNTASSFVQTAAGNCWKLCTPEWVWSTVSHCHRRQRKEDSFHPLQNLLMFAENSPAILQPLAFPPNHHHEILFNYSTSPEARSPLQPQQALLFLLWTNLEACLFFSDWLVVP